ncbi:phytanoyl-CoA dioxygenase family protein [Kiloniella laminariae]|uniref:Phytanoyl-CoA dioxygenase family protein n=1 Tax=Kiloniella laminariae TaxID=454162 RepID=A0ABT4LML2_9PROT|nr:phytanoyl-CoA dioxygenase family protein [Kiloniella laminariae]MCZ4281202.1 phytanoyl-CoA dioxygenase family protein [Kiloniella laminariae]
MADKDLRENFERDGYVFPLEIMTAEEARACRKRLEDLEAGAHPPLKRPLNEYLRGTAHYLSMLAADLSQDSRILGAVEQLLGPDLLVWSCEFFIKEAGSTRMISWHQDLTYWGLGEEAEEVTAWLALSRSDQASGCMKFVPGSHQNMIVPHRDTFNANNLLSRGQEIAVEVHEEEAVAVELEPGQLSLHHGRIFHGSGANASGDRRIGVAIRYITPRVRQQVGEKDYAMLVRGVDEYGHFHLIAPPARDFGVYEQELFERVYASQLNVFAQGVDPKIPLYASNRADS